MVRKQRAIKKTGSHIEVMRIGVIFIDFVCGTQSVTRHLDIISIHFHLRMKRIELKILSSRFFIHITQYKGATVHNID